MDFTLRNKVIKEIQTPEGARIVYGHDNQNAPQILESVKKYQGLDLISEVEFGYDNDKRLTSITDSMGRNVAQTIYENGRIKEVIDADENVTGYTFNTSRNTQIVKTKADKDADTWFETELRLDGSGNILYEKTPGGAETYYKYKGNLLVEKKVSTTNQDRPVSLTTTYRHNSNGQIIEETDPQGNVTENEYNEYGQLTAAKRNGVSVSSTMYDYDSKLPIRSTDANGNTTNYKYVGQNLTEIRSGSETLVKNHYNTYGQIEKTIANNRETSFLYDTAGNCTQTSYTEQDETISDHTTYDSMGRVLSHSRQVGASTTWTTTTVYDPEGQVSSETDQNGMTTIYKYDACGRKVQTITQVRDSDENSVPVSLYSETCYDAMGRVIASTENHLSAASNVLGTINEYDADGRVIKTEQHKGMVITVTDINNHVSTSVLTTEGTLLSVTITDYNSAGWVTSSFDQYGLETRYTYDDFGNTIQVARQSPVEKSSPNEGWDMKWLVSRTVYDKFGRVSIATDQFVVELEANLLENMSPPAYATKTLYDAQGRVIESVRLTGVTVKIDIKTSQEELDDAFKDKPNIAAVLVLPGAKVHTSVTRYNEKGQVAKTISPEGVATFYEYDDLGRQTKTVTNHLQTVTEYDKMGRVARVCVSNVADPDNKRTTAYAYDPFGNIAMTQFPNNSSIRATFNAKGQKTSETNQMGHTRRFEYDSQGRLIKVTMPRANDSDSVGSEPVYEYAYDSLGNQTLIRDPLGRETRFTYDSRGNQLTRTLPLGYGTNGKWDSGESLVPATHTERFEYDEYGRQILHIAFEGAHTKSEYDSYGRLATKKFYTNAANYAAGTVVDIWTYKYDVFGRETSLTQAWSGMRNWTTTTTYDVLGRITKHKRPNQYGILKYEYDHFGRQTSATLSIDETTTANDKATTYEYDGWGRLWKVEDHDGQLTTYEYDVFGNRSSTTLPNDVVTTYAYDNMNRLLVEESKKGATLVSKFEYTYTDLGQKTKATETHRIAGVDKSIVTQWEYDDLSRLTKETLTHYTPANSKTQTWEYDAVGNRTQQACGTQTTSYTYNVNDQLTDELLTDSSVSANARLTKRTYSASRVTQEICYRGTDEVSANRLWQKDHSYQHDGPHYVTTLYHWNGMGTFLRREYVRSLANADGLVMMTDYYTNDSGVNSTAWTSKFRSIYLYDHFNSTGYAQVVRETYNDTLSGTVLVRTHSHTFGHDRISETTTLVSQPNDPQKVFFLHDGLGNTRALTSANGTIAQRYDYDAFGNAIGFEPGEALTRFLYCGELFDHKLGWTYLRARYYDPKVGRFNRLDPFFGVISDPQSLHKYTYCHGDPVNHTDPSGRFLAISMSSVGIGAAIGGLIGAGLGAYRDGWQGALVGALAGGASGAAAGLFSPALAAAFGKSILGYMGYGATTGLIGGFTHGGIYGTLLPHGNFGFDLKNGMGLALFEGVTGMFAGMILGPIGYIFGKAPKPSGTPDPELKREMIKMANSTFFRARANVWSKITGRGRINWDKLTTKLEKAEFRQFADAKEAGRSGGWAGLGDDGNWLFAVNRSWGGKTTMAHELFHGVQDIQASIFSRSMGPLGIAASETTAHLFGGPLIGVPASGIAFLIGWGLFAAVDIWLDVYETLPDIQ